MWMVSFYLIRISWGNRRNVRGYCHIGGIGMTSAELKHGAKLQEWAARIQDCRSSGLSVRAWCRQEEINAAT